MSIAGLVFISSVIALLVWVLWMFYCIHKTSEHITRLINLPLCDKNNDPQSYYNWWIVEFNVSKYYDKHMYTLLTFGKWKKLYPSDVIAMYEKINESSRV
jgi:hypothetical protein